MAATDPQVDPPRGIFPAKVDDKGRLKLPANFHEYLQSLGTTKTFITTLDKATCKIYTISAWNANLKLLEGAADKKAAEALRFRASDWGQDSDLDPQGRLMLPTDLRRHLKMENAPVWMQAGDGYIDVLNEELYRQRKLKSDETLDGKMDYFLELGLK
ncbi:MAG: hypothetical protein SFV51_17820 [Bryobacteraceae bacterium]|nr:hypothetical protein [Bryobacteraceae bacterium]